MRQLDGRLDVHAGHHAVLFNAGVQQRGNARVPEAIRRLLRGFLVQFAPALDGNATIALVQGDNNPARELAACIDNQLRIFNRGGAENDPLNALIDPKSDALHVANAPAQLNRQGTGRNYR